MEDNFLDQLAQAPPAAMTSADIDAAKAAQTAQAANLVANAITSPGQTGQAVADRNTPPAPENDSVAAAKSPARFGHFGRALTGAINDLYSNPATAAFATAPGGAARTMFLAANKALNTASTPAPPSIPNPAPVALSAENAISGAPSLPPRPAVTDQERENFLSTLPGQGPKAPPAPPPPLRGAAGFLTHAVGSLQHGLAGLGDVSAGPGSGGAIAAFGRVAAASSAREERERLQTATANAQMLHEQGLIHKLGNDAVDGSIDAGKKAIENFTTPVPGGADITPEFTGKTSDELNELIKNQQLDPTKQTAFPDGKKLDGQWPDGQPKYRTTYTVLTLSGDRDVSVDNAKLINSVLGGINGKKISENADQLQRLPAATLNAVLQKAYTAQAAKAAFDVGMDALLEKKEAHESSELAKTIEGNPVVASALNAASVPGSGPSNPDIYASVKAYPALLASKDPRLPANWQQAYKEAATGESGPAADKAWTEMNQSFAKAQQTNIDTVDQMLNTAETNPKEIEGHTPAFTGAMKAIIRDPDNYTIGPNNQKIPNSKVVRALKGLSLVEEIHTLEMDDEKAKAAGKKPDTEPAGDTSLQGQDYVRSLPAGERALVEGLGTGPMDLTRLDYLLSRPDGKKLGEEIALAYGDSFDSSRVKQYVKAYQDFTSGKTATLLNSAGAVLQHLEELKGINDENPVESRIPKTDAYIAYHNKFDTISGELSQFYQLSKTDKETEKMVSTLGGEFRRDAAIDTQLQSMADKLTSFRNQWTNAAPSDAYEAKMPNVSQEGRAALARMLPGFTQAHPEFAPSVGADWKVMQIPGVGRTWKISPDKFAEAQKFGAVEVKHKQ